jgi:hypothetical protein
MGWDCKEESFGSNNDDGENGDGQIMMVGAAMTTTKVTTALWRRMPVAITVTGTRHTAQGV